MNRCLDTVYELIAIRQCDFYRYLVIPDTHSIQIYGCVDLGSI